MHEISIELDTKSMQNVSSAANDLSQRNIKVA